MCEVNPREGFGNALKLKQNTRVKSVPFNSRQTEGNCCLSFIDMKTPNIIHSTEGLVLLFK